MGGHSLRRLPGWSFLATRITVAFFAFTGTSCATYQPASIEELNPSERVRIQVGPEYLAQYVAFIQGERGQMSARFLGMNADSAVFRLEGGGGYREATLPLSTLLDIERRESKPGRSLLFSAGIVGGVAALAYLGFEGRDDASGDGEPPEPENVIPIMMFTIPIGR